LVFTQYSQIPSNTLPKNTLPRWRVFNLAKNTLEWRGIVGISRDYLLKTRTSKQPIGEIPGYEIIPSHPLKYPRSKQGLTHLSSLSFPCALLQGRESVPTTSSVRRGGAVSAYLVIVYPEIKELRMCSVLEFVGMERDGSVPRTRFCVRLRPPDGTNSSHRREYSAQMRDGVVRPNRSDDAEPSRNKSPLTFSP
jgi:hypothetical protein